ncbi:MAG TPA: tRNA glutamyl-Q(34) synthetase GluQRS [Methylotenera sp.]|nr:tRNA glutamyl-Q(34) synthetase GluQRS [Methylotenera sp.]
MQYIGRFAPSPTGPLHFGSLVAAVASYCDAKYNQGKWLVRMEDVDKPREMVGAADDILRTLEAFGFEWDSADSNSKVIFQSQRGDIYQHYLEQLNRDGYIYACTCSRKEIADSATSAGIEGAIYPKTCLLKPAPQASNIQTNNPAAYRAMVLDKNISFTDAIQGEVTQNLAIEIGDFILKRKDGLFAYQLTVVVDDALQGITHVVRGADLLNSTPRQIYLQQLLGFTTPYYAHVPVIVNALGEKLSKQTLANPITPESAPTLVFEALCFLGQNPPDKLKHANLADIWRWAITHWQLASVPRSTK